MLPLQFYLEQWTRLPPAPTGDLLKGKNVILTGANGGIGFEAALQLAALKPKTLILTVRSLSAGPELVEKVLAKHPRVNVEVWALDLGSYESIKAFAKRAEGLGVVDVLLNNAGMNPGPAMLPMKKTKDGHDLTTQTNVLAPVLLSLLLRDVMAKSASPRIVFTTSEVHAWIPGTEIAAAPSILEYCDEEKSYVNGRRYLESKMIVRRLIPVLPVTIVAVNPGLCASNLARHFHFSFNFNTIYQAAWMRFHRRTAEVGARNLTFATVVQDDSCEYYTSCHPGFSESTFLSQRKGMRAVDRFSDECMAEFEKASPGCTSGLSV